MMGSGGNAVRRDPGVGRQGVKHSVFDQGGDSAVYGCHIGGLFIGRHRLNQSFVNVGNGEVPVYGLEDIDNSDTGVSAAQSVRAQQLSDGIACCGVIAQVAGIARGPGFRQYSAPFAST